MLTGGTAADLSGRVHCVPSPREGEEPVPGRWSYPEFCVTTAASRHRVGRRPPAQLGPAVAGQQVSWPPWRLRLEQLLLPVVVQFEPVARSFGRDVKVLDDNVR